MDESQQATAQPIAGGRRTGGKVTLAILILAGTAFAVIRYLPANDKAVRQACVGTWRAVDPTNAALHMEEAEVTSETAIVHLDGSLEYAIETAPPNESKRADTWGWRIKKGHLQLRFRGTGDAEPWLEPLDISVDETSLRINRTGYPVKEFARVAE